MPDSPEPQSPIAYKVRVYNNASTNKTVFFFCPFGIPSWVLALPWLPIWRLRKNGYSVISYSYSTDFATKSLKLTIDNFRSIINDANARIAELIDTHEIICFGTSMGTVLASNVAAEHPQITKVVLNLSYADISDHIVALPNIRTIPSKTLRNYIASAGGEQSMRMAFEPYSPLMLVRSFKGKKVLLYSSKDDTILKKIHTAKFHEALLNAKIDLHYYENSRGGHYFAALINYLRYTRWLRFLNS